MGGVHAGTELACGKHEACCTAATAGRPPGGGAPQLLPALLPAVSLEAGGCDRELAQAAVLAADVSVPHSAHIVPEQLRRVIVLNLGVLQVKSKAQQGKSKRPQPAAICHRYPPDSTCQTATATALQKEAGASATRSCAYTPWCLLPALPCPPATPACLPACLPACQLTEMPS